MTDSFPCSRCAMRHPIFKPQCLFPFHYALAYSPLVLVSSFTYFLSELLHRFLRRGFPDHPTLTAWKRSSCHNFLSHFIILQLWDPPSPYTHTHTTHMPALRAQRRWVISLWLIIVPLVSSPMSSTQQLLKIQFIYLTHLLNQSIN